MLDEAEEYNYPKEVSIAKADNGFIVSCYGRKGQEKKIAKDMSEAVEFAEVMMGKVEKENFKQVKEKANKMALKKK